MKLVNFDNFSDDCKYALIDGLECEFMKHRECVVQDCPKCRVISINEFIDRGGESLCSAAGLFEPGFDTVEVI